MGARHLERLKCKCILPTVLFLLLSVTKVHRIVSFLHKKLITFFLGSGIAQHSTGDTLSPAPPVFLGDYIRVYGSSAFSPVGLHTADAGATQLTN